MPSLNGMVIAAKVNFFSLRLSDFDRRGSATLNETTKALTGISGLKRAPSEGVNSLQEGPLKSKCSLALSDRRSYHVAPSKSRGPSSGAALHMNTPDARSACARRTRDCICVHEPEKIEKTVERGECRAPNDVV